MRGKETDRASVDSTNAGAAAAPDPVSDLKERIDVLTAFTHGMILELDREGRYLRVWAGDPRLLARPIEELIGRTVREVLGAGVGTRFHEYFQTVYDTGKPITLDYSLDVPAGRRTFACEVRRHEPPGGGTPTLTLLVVDVTEAKSMEAKLVQAERLAALGLLSASVGHEIRQPLAYVGTSLDVLERELAGLELSPEARASLDNLRSGARRITEIASSLDLLSARRPRSNRAIDVRRPLKAALDLCASELSRLHVTRALPELPPVDGDEGELCQVFANLILNAAQAIPTTGDGPKTLVVSGARVGDRVRVSVTDSGEGMPPEHLEHIFDPFFTTKGKGGTGLGLFITRGIVEAHGGSLAVESAAGSGTTFDVFLPIATPSELRQEPTTGMRSVAMRTALTPTAATPATRERLQVLLVDDEPRFLDSLRLALDDTHDVVTRTKASEALELLAKDPQHFDVVLCDLAMPEMDGVTFYERMQSMGIADRFVLMTGGAFTPRASEFLARNACPSIGKPFLLERLLALLDSVSRSRRAS